MGTIGNVGAKIVGLDAFAAYLESIGIRARVVPTPAELGQGFFARDQSVLAVDGSVFSFVSLRLSGALGPRALLSRGAFGVRVGSLPVLGTEVLPIEYHYVARVREAYPWLETKLVQETKGLVRRRRVSLRFTDSLMGERFDHEAGVIDPIVAHIGLDDGLDVRADPERKIVRIVHKRPAVLKYNVFGEGEIVRFHREHAPPDLIGAFARMAEMIVEAKGGLR